MDHLFPEGLFFCISMMGAILLALNIAVQYPFNGRLTWRAFTFPIAFLLTDLTNRFFSVGATRWVVVFGCCVGMLLSFIFTQPRIAIASCAAFLVPQLLDTVIFNRVRAQVWWRAPLISSLLASAVDMLIVFAGAFAMTGLPWMIRALGDYGAKLRMAAVLLVPFRLLIALLPAGLSAASGGGA